MATILSIIFAYLCVGVVFGFIFNDRDRWDNGTFFACLFGWGFLVLFAIVVLFFMAIDVIFEIFEEMLGD